MPSPITAVRHLWPAALAVAMAAATSSGGGVEEQVTGMAQALALWCAVIDILVAVQLTLFL